MAGHDLFEKVGLSEFLSLVTVNNQMCKDAKIKLEADGLQLSLFGCRQDEQCWKL